ncbi:hypothetical protein D3C87_308600 [compost metagenome]
MLLQLLRRFNQHYRTVLLALGLIGCGVFVLKWNGASWRQGVVNSDGRGYYYFLPALIQGEADYQLTRKQEEKAIGKPSQPYILPTENGRWVNKCYPGVALLQAPSFLIATAIDAASGEAFNGYSDTHLYFFFWTNVFFLFASIILLRSNLKTYFGMERYTWIASLLTVFATNIAYQAFFYPGLSHQYTFFLVNLWICFFLKWKTDGKLASLALFALASGLMVLVRPTNLLFFLFIPFLAGNWQMLRSVFTDLFRLRNGKLLVAIVLFCAVVSILPLATYLQTGHFFYWSYQGEGFIFNGAHFLDTWISYRTGILVHTPLVIVGVIGLVLVWRKERFAVSAVVLALMVVTFILSSWWCWDYQLFFGHRGFTEFHAITAFLLMYFLISVKNRLVIICSLAIPVIYLSIRTYQKITNLYSVQKFTGVTYWKSLFDFDASVQDKYLVFTNCQPFGKVLATYDLMKGKEHYQKMGQEVDFWPQIDFEIPKELEHCRFYAEVHLNKRFIQAADSSDWKEVALIFAGSTKGGELTHYAGYPVYNYYKEGKDKWSGYDLAEEFNPAADGTERIIIYLMNPKHKQYEIDDFRVTLKAIDSNP